MTSYYESSAGLAKTGCIVQMLIYISFGAFIADTIYTARFDWSLINGAKKRKWMHLIYFGAKLSLFIYFIINFALLWNIKKIDCNAWMISIEFMMGLAVIFSSTLLSFRTIVVNRINGTKVPVTAILVVAGLGLIASWLYGVTDVQTVWLTAAKQAWNDGQCVPMHIKETYFVKYVVTIVFDFLVLALAVYGILIMNSRSRFGDILIKQGVIYFLVSLAANIAITILTILKLSPLMSLMLSVPQSTICIIAATRLYSQLSIEGANNSHVPSDTRGSSFQNSSLKNNKDQIMTLEEGLQIEVHTVTTVTY